MVAVRNVPGARLRAVAGSSPVSAAVTAASPLAAAVAAAAAAAATAAAAVLRCIAESRVWCVPSSREDIHRPIIVTPPTTLRRASVNLNT